MHRVKYVAEDALPEEHDWAMVEDRGRFVLCVKRKAVCPKVLAEAWAAYRHLAERAA